MRRVTASILAVALVAAATVAQAQGAGGRCDLVFDNTPTTRFSSEKIGDNTYNTFLGGGVLARCAGQDVTLRSDSAEAYGASNLLYLIGNVRYVEPRARVDADRMTYYRADERLLAEGSVYAVLPSGTSMRGPTADYYRDVPAVRPRTRLVAPGRPRVQLVEGDSGTRRREPTVVVANTIVMEGDSLVYAGGRVELTRPDVEARADSAYLDGGNQFARLMRSPSIVGRQRRPFTLTGSLIELYSRDRQLARVLAMREATATSEDLTLTADTVDMRLSAAVTNNTVERVFAWGRSRARAVSPGRDIVADSLDVRMPGQRLQAVHAVKDAYAQTATDSTRLVSRERDWLRGDTIVAHFDTVPAATATGAQAPPTTPSRVARAPRGRAAPPKVASVAPAVDPPAARRDTTARPRMRDLVASGSARAYYQVPSRQGRAAPPAINYVRGRLITVFFADNAVDRVTVVDRAAGLYVEPAPDSTAGRPATRPPGPAVAPTVAPARPVAPTRPNGAPRP